LLSARLSTVCWVPGCQQFVECQAVNSLLSARLPTVCWVPGCQQFVECQAVNSLLSARLSTVYWVPGCRLCVECQAVNTLLSVRLKTVCWAIAWLSAEHWINNQCVWILTVMGLTSGCWAGMCGGVGDGVAWEGGGGEGWWTQRFARACPECMYLFTLFKDTMRLILT
jgi:hypothetical protein